MSKNLLKAVAVGVALSTSFASCEVFEDVGPEALYEEVCNENCETKCQIHARHNSDPCPACGMG